MCSCEEFEVKTKCILFYLRYPYIQPLLLTSSPLSRITNVMRELSQEELCVHFVCCFLSSEVQCVPRFQTSLPHDRWVSSMADIPLHVLIASVKDHDCWAMLDVL
jgi:hypothetical protein